MTATTLPAAASISAKRVRTTCPYCAVQCNFDLFLEDGLPVKVAPTKECPVAHGTVCKKGLAALSDLRHPDRLTRPLLRKHGELVPVSWDEAWAYLSEALTPLVQAAPERIGVFGSGSLTNEKTYLLGKLARVALRTPNIDYNGRYCMSSAATALNRTVGLDRGLGFPLSDVARSDLIVLVGANIAETLPPIMQYLKAAKDKGAVVYSLDPRATPTGKVAGRHLALRPGSDAALMCGLLCHMEQAGKIQPSAPSHGAEAVLAHARAYTPERVARECGISEADFLTLARAYAAADRPLLLTGRGAEQHAHGTDTVQACLNLAFLSGHFGKHGGGYGPLTGQGNGQGGREHGQKNDQLPGYRLLRNPQHRAEMAAFWGIEESDLPQPGLSAQELLNACGEQIEALIVIGSNPVVSAAGTDQIRERLGRLKHLIVIDFLSSETAGLATLVLPGSMWCEEEGTTTNLEGRVQRRRKAVTAPGASLEDWRILCGIARAVGRSSGFEYPNFEALQDEFLRSTKGGKADYSGLSAEQLDAGSAQWPVKNGHGHGTRHPYHAPYATPDGKATLHVPSLPAPGAPHRLTLTTGRHANQYQSGTQSRRNAGLRATLEVHIHPEVAARQGIATGDPVRLTTAHGAAELPALVTPTIRPDTLFVAFHWPDAANALTDPEALDPHSKMPAFKAVTGVTLAPAAAPHAAERRPPESRLDRLPSIGD